jgi:hypothetical protein
MHLCILAHDGDFFGDNLSLLLAVVSARAFRTDPSPK